MDDFSLDVSNLVTQDHLSVSSVSAVVATTLVEPEKLGRRLLIVACCNDLISSLDKSDDVISITLSRSDLSDSVVLQTPCS